MRNQIPSAVCTSKLALIHVLNTKSTRDTMHQPRRHGADDVAFPASSADAEDYYAFLPSDESMSDVEDAPASPKRAGNRDAVDDLASVFASSSSIGCSSKILTPIGSLAGSGSAYKEKQCNRQQIKAPAPGVFALGGGQELRVSPRALEQHNARRTQLQAALDAATGDEMSDGEYGEAPFRFVTKHKRTVKFADEMEVEEAPETERVEAQKKLGRRQPAGEEKEEGSDDSEEETVEPDPLYDGELDDADEQWVQTNFGEFLAE